MNLPPIVQQFQADTSAYEAAADRVIAKSSQVGSALNRQYGDPGAAAVSGLLASAGKFALAGAAAAAAFSGAFGGKTSSTVISQHAAAMPAVVESYRRTGDLAARAFQQASANVLRVPTPNADAARRFGEFSKVAKQTDLANLAVGPTVRSGLTGKFAAFGGEQDLLDRAVKDMSARTGIDLAKIVNKVTFLSPDEMRKLIKTPKGEDAALGGFRKETATIFLNRDLLKNPDQLKQTLAHELGHAFDKFTSPSLTGAYGSANFETVQAKVGRMAAPSWLRQQLMPAGYAKYLSLPEEGFARTFQALATGTPAGAPGDLLKAWLPTLVANNGVPRRVDQDKAFIDRMMDPEARARLEKLTQMPQAGLGKVWQALENLPLGRAAKMLAEMEQIGLLDPTKFNKGGQNPGGFKRPRQLDDLLGRFETDPSAMFGLNTGAFLWHTKIAPAVEEAKKVAGRFWGGLINSPAEQFQRQFTNDPTVRNELMKDYKRAQGRVIQNVSRDFVVSGIDATGAAVKDTVRAQSVAAAAAIMRARGVAVGGVVDSAQVSAARIMQSYTDLVRGGTGLRSLAGQVGMAVNAGAAGVARGAGAAFQFFNPNAQIGPWATGYGPRGGAGYRAAAFLANNRITRGGLRLGGRAMRAGAGAGVGLAQRVGRSAFSLASRPARLGLIGMAVAVPAAFAAASVAAVKLAADYEQVSVAFKVLTGSGQAAARMLKDIDDLATQTPFTSRELAGQAKALSAFGIKNSDIVPTLRMIGDIAAGTGTSMERIVLAYGQVQSQGRLMGPELRQFTDAGIPILDALAGVMNRPTLAIKGMTTEGLVMKDKVTEAFVAMTSEGGKFYNMMAEQSQTVAGKFSNLQDFAEQALRRIGAAFLKGFNVGELLDRVSNALQGIAKADMSSLEAFFGRMREVFDVILVAVQAIGEAIQTKMVAGIEGFSGKMDWNNWKEVAIGAIRATVSAIGLIADGVRSLLLTAVGMLEQMSQGMVDMGLIKGKKEESSIYDQYRAKGGSKFGSFAATAADWIVGGLGMEETAYDSQRYLGLNPWAQPTNPLAGLADKAKKAFGEGDFGSLFLKNFDRLLGQSQAAPKKTKAEEDRDARSTVEVRMASLRERFKLGPQEKGLSNQAMELFGKTFGDFKTGIQGGPLGAFNTQMRRLDELRNYRDDKGRGFFDQDPEVYQFGRIQAFKQLAATVQQREYQPLSGVDMGSKEEAVIVARSMDQSKDMLTEIRNTLTQALEMQKRQVEYDAAIAMALTGWDPGPEPVGGRID